MSDPMNEFYEATGDDKDFIISHKSTIPDLVIWNKTFNKNECDATVGSNEKSAHLSGINTTFVKVSVFVMPSSV